MRTFQKELPEDAHAGVFALDCEMVSLGSREPGSPRAGEGVKPAGNWQESSWLRCKTIASTAPRPAMSPWAAVSG